MLRCACTHVRIAVSDGVSLRIDPTSDGASGYSAPRQARMVAAWGVVVTDRADYPARFTPAWSAA